MMYMMHSLIEIAKQLFIIALFTIGGLLLSAIHFSVGHFFLPIITPYFLFWIVMGIITGVIVANIAFKGE